MKIHTRHCRLPILISWILTIGLSTADPEASGATELKDLLQQGLFEEEATRKFDKAAMHYEKLLAEFESQEQLAATALYRLAEVRRKQNRNDDAIILYQKFIARFPDHDPLARLSRENLAALGAADGFENEATSTPTRSDEEAKKIRELKLVAEESPDLLKTGDHLKTAISKGHLQVVTFLLDSGIAPDTDNALATAAGFGHLALCRLLADRGANVNGTSDGETTPLQAAVSGNRETVVRYLIECGADPNLPEIAEDRPLLLALGSKRQAIAKILLENGADPNINSTAEARERYNLLISPRGNVGTPLHEALYQGDAKMANLLLDHGAGVNARLLRTQLTPLHLAAAIGDKQLIGRLLKEGAKVDAETRNASINARRDSNSSSYSTYTMKGGQTPLFYAMSHDSTEVAVILIAAGASFQDSPMLPQRAAEKGLAFAKLAFAEGIPVSFRTANDDTLLHRAAAYSRLELCKYLIDQGTELDSKNQDGITPLQIVFGNLDYAVRNPASRSPAVPMSIARLLIERGADPTRKDSTGGVISLVSKRINHRLENARSFWYPAIAGRSDSAVTVVLPELGRSWELALKKGDPATAVFPLTLLNWSPPQFDVHISENSRGSNSTKTSISWTDGTLYRKNAGSGELEEIKFDLENLETYPALQGGDLLEFRLRDSFGDEYEENSLSSRNGSWPQSVAVALNSGIEFKVNVRMDGAPEQLVLTGGIRVFDPTKQRAPIANAEELARLLGAEHPRFHNALLRVNRPGWGAIEAVKGTRAAKIELKAGDTLEVLPDPNAGEVQFSQWRNKRVTLVSPGLPFARTIDATEAPPSLLQLIAFAYGPYSAAAMDGREMDWEEFLYDTTKFSYQVVLPHPDFSKIRIYRDAKPFDSVPSAWKDGILEVDLTEAIASAARPEEARAADIALRAGDIVELPILQDDLGKPWTGFDKQTTTFLRKAMTYRVNTFNSNGDHQPIILQYEPPGFMQTPAGIAIYRRTEDSVYQTDISALVTQLFGSTRSSSTFKVTREEGEQKVEFEGRGGYSYFLRDMDTVQVTPGNPVIRPASLPQPSAQLQAPSHSRRRVALPPPSSR